MLLERPCESMPGWTHHPGLQWRCDGAAMPRRQGSNGNSESSCTSRRGTLALHPQLRMNVARLLPWLQRGSASG